MNNPELAFLLGRKTGGYARCQNRLAHLAVNPNRTALAELEKRKDQLMVKLATARQSVVNLEEAVGSVLCEIDGLKSPN